MHSYREERESPPVGPPGTCSCPRDGRDGRDGQPGATGECMCEWRQYKPPVTLQQVFFLLSRGKIVAVANIRIIHGKTKFMDRARRILNY